MKRKIFTLLAALGAFASNVGAWNYEGHHAVNELALASLPKDFGIELTPALKGRIEYLAGEPDRWRNVTDVPLTHASAPDHYIDLEDLKLFGLTPETLPIMRYDFVIDIAKAHEAHPEKFPVVDPMKDADHKSEVDGFLPWAITEYYEKLKSDFTVLKVLKQYGGTPEEIANAQADCVYVMGVMGHFVGDGSQPLHTTMHYDGWVGDNPKGYTTGPVKGEKSRIHAWIDGGYFKKTGGIKVDQLVGKIQPATHIANAGDAEAFFRTVVSYLAEQNKFVEPLYEMEKNGQLTGDGDKGMEGLPFLNGQIVKGAQMLGDIWYTAWLESPDEDNYLQKQLSDRAAAAAPPN